MSTCKRQTRHRIAGDWMEPDMLIAIGACTSVFKNSKHLVSLFWPKPTFDRCPVPESDTPGETSRPRAGYRRCGAPRPPETAREWAAETMTGGALGAGSWEPIMRHPCSPSVLPRYRVCCSVFLPELARQWVSNPRLQWASIRDAATPHDGTEHGSPTPCRAPVTTTPT